MRVSNRILTIAATLFFVSFSFFLINIQFPATPNFDEFHYIPSAKQFLEMKENQNWEHPPLAKMLIAIGIGIWGDRPIGWRFMSAVFGALTLVGMYLFAWVLFESEQAALFVATLTIFNQLLFVQARIGMLDTFMFGFLIWGMAAFCATWNRKRSAQENYSLLLFAGMMFGLSIACKWFSILPWVFCLGLVAAIRVLQYWKTEFAQPKDTDWYHPLLWHGITWREWVISLVGVPILFYFITFIPLLFTRGETHSFFDLFAMQYKMWDGQLRVVNSHPYMSKWTDWPLLIRPIWYAFDKDPANSNIVRGVILLGNPLIMWGGILALMSCVYRWVKSRDYTSFFILFLYCSFYFCWILIPRKISFYYYYYPAGMVLSFALANAFFYRKEVSAYIQVKAQKLGYQKAAWIFAFACCLVFVYFYPILAALRIPADSFRKWMWFSSWI